MKKEYIIILILVVIILLIVWNSYNQTKKITGATQSFVKEVEKTNGLAVQVINKLKKELAEAKDANLFLVEKLNGQTPPGPQKS